MPNIYIRRLILVIFFFINITAATAHEPGTPNLILYHKTGEIRRVPVHQYIAQQSIKSWTNSPSELQNYTLLGSITSTLDNLCNAQYNGNGESGTADNLVVGSGEEDQQWNPLFCPGSGFKSEENCEDEGLNGYFEHFWDPDKPEDSGFNCGAIGGGHNSGLRDIVLVAPYNGKYMDSNFRLAQYYWDWKVLPYYTGKYPNGNLATVDKNQAYYWLGRVVHLLTDLTVPAHVHNDVHAPGYGYDSFESYIANWDRIKSYRGEYYKNLYYKYDLLGTEISIVAPGFEWSDVYESENPPDLFKLFWYTAQKSQYFASDNADGDKGKFTRWDGTEDTFGKPGLWKILQ